MANGLEMELDLIVKFYSGYDVSFPPMGCTTSLHTVVYSPKDLSLIIGVGENCAPIMVSLKDYLDETLTLPAVIKGKININGFLISALAVGAILNVRDIIEERKLS